MASVESGEVPHLVTSLSGPSACGRRDDEALDLLARALSGGGLAYVGVARADPVLDML